MFEVNKKVSNLWKNMFKLDRSLYQAFSLSANKSVNFEIQVIWSQWENSIFLQTSDCLDEVDFKTL